MSSDAVNFAAFVRLLAPPKPAPRTPSPRMERSCFIRRACDLCHYPGVDHLGFDLRQFERSHLPSVSDFALHHMGSGLADGIVQGSAGADQFRTAPLWGVGQRLFFCMTGGRRTAEAIKHTARAVRKRRRDSQLEIAQPSQIQDLPEFSAGALGKL